MCNARELACEAANGAIAQAGIASAIRDMGGSYSAVVVVSAARPWRLNGFQSIHPAPLVRMGLVGPIGQNGEAQRQRGHGRGSKKPKCGSGCVIGAVSE